MIDRFLRYSLAHGRKIKVMLERDGGMKSENITVLSIEGDTVYYLSAKKKAAQEMPLAAILAATYARGDEGDTLVNAQQEGNL